VTPLELLRAYEAWTWAQQEVAAARCVAFGQASPEQLERLELTARRFCELVRAATMETIGGAAAPLWDTRREAFWSEALHQRRPDWHHRDHALNVDHFMRAERECAARTGFFIAQVEVEQPLPCGLYGPIMGDEPVADGDVTLEQRSPDRPLSRRVQRPLRPSHTMTVIGVGPYQVFTAYGGPCAPREPGDPTIPDEAGRAESAAFWSQHALSW
jgi:hypothetical protein